MIGTVLRALGFFAISALLLGEGLLILWASLGGWAATMLGILAALTGAGLWGLIAIEGLLGQLRRRAGSASSATQASGRGWSGWRRSSGWWPSLSPFTVDARRPKTTRQVPLWVKSRRDVRDRVTAGSRRSAEERCA